MATTYFDGWETNPGNKIIQNTDYLTSQYVKTCAIALAGNYLDWGQGVNGFDSVNFVNKNFLSLHNNPLFPSLDLVHIIEILFLLLLLL